jgi:hypothetical protein
MDIYRITRYRVKPEYYQNGKSTVYGTKNRAALIVKSNQGRGQSFKIERAPVGEFTDVTAEFTGEEE